MFIELKTNNPPNKKTKKPKTTQTQQEEYTVRAGLKIVEIEWYGREKKQSVQKAYVIQHPTWKHSSSFGWIQYRKCESVVLQNERNFSVSLHFTENSGSKIKPLWEWNKMESKMKTSSLIFFFCFE